MKIFAHRGNLEGRVPGAENTIPHLQKAIDRGYGVEFDINFDSDASRLVLSHDVASYEAFREVEAFLSRDFGEELHALNVKNLQTLPAILNFLERREILANFFLFDFELLIPDIREARFLMKALQKRGVKVAFRLSERENFVEFYASSPEISYIWLDEFAEPWGTQAVMRQLVQSGKRVFYVSPELHGSSNWESIETRWQQMFTWGAAGICTDFPLRLHARLNQWRLQ